MARNVLHIVNHRHQGRPRLDILSHRRQQCPGGDLGGRIHGYKGCLGRPSDAIKCRNKFIRKKIRHSEGALRAPPECRRPPALRGLRGPPLRQWGSQQRWSNTLCKNQDMDPQNGKQMTFLRLTFFRLFVPADFFPADFLS